VSMIEVKNVTKRYGEKAVVDNLNFEVNEGEIFGFIGPSGSGKTTTIRLLTGVIRPTEGQVRLMGEDPSHQTSKMREKFGYLPQLFVLYPNLTVRENLNFAGSLYGMTPRSRRKRIKELLGFVELVEAANRTATNISGGMLRRLELAAALLHDPPLLFADEPTAGIDPVLRGKFWEEFRHLRSMGRTVFVTTQYVGETEYCDRVGIIRAGKLLAVDTPEGLRRSALGGEIVDITSDNLTPEGVHMLAQLPIVHHLQTRNRNELRAYVVEASQAIPALIEVLTTAGCNVSSVEEYKPSFDEIFIDIMKREDAKDADNAANGKGNGNGRGIATGGANAGS
jgi:ABC-2 type transport system ATP-binding protein